MSWAVCGGQRRWINTEDNAKVVAAVWGTKLLKFLSALAIFALERFEE